MLTYEMSKRGQRSLYEYLYQCIRDDIIKGTLVAEEKLPSKRMLARHLQVSVVTVENAYQQLEAEGYIYAQEKRGYFVSLVETFAQEKETAITYHQERETRKWDYDLLGGRNTEGFPFSLWAKLMRQVLTERGESLLESSPSCGVLELREAIAQYLLRFRGMQVHPSQIIIGAGAEYLYDQMVQLLGNHLCYGVEQPGYPKVQQVYTLHGANCVGIPLDEGGMQLGAVCQSGAQVLHLSPSHQFPTGVVIPIGRRQALLKWAEEKPERYIIEDDYDSEFRFMGTAIPTLQSIDQAQRVIYINTFSRTLAPSLRMGYMVLPPVLIERYHMMMGFYSCTVPVMEQYTLARFLSQGYFERHLNRMRGLYRNKRDRILELLQNSPLAGQYQVQGAERGLHFLLKLPTNKSDKELKWQAEQQKVRLAFLSEYGGGEQHWLLMHYPGIQLEQLEEGLALLSKLL